MGQINFPQISKGFFILQYIRLKIRGVFYTKPLVPCELVYIPCHLVKNGRKNLDKFFLGEFLYYRCEEAVKSNPFDKISLIDLSHNRSGTWFNFLSKPEDVLYNTNPLKPEQIIDLSIACLKIEELIDNAYIKEIKEPADNPATPIIPEQLVCVIKLKHKPIECNYSHCAFEFYLNNTEVTFDNYRTTLGHKSSNPTKIRTRCKHEISKMIIKEVVRINF